MGIQGDGHEAGRSGAGACVHIYEYMYTHTQCTDMIGATQVRSSVLVQLNSERMKTRHARDAALSEMSQLINSVKAPVLAMDGMGLLVQWNAMLVQLTG